MTDNSNTSATFWQRLLACLIDIFIFFFLHTYFWSILAQSASGEKLLFNLYLYLVIVIISPIGIFYQVLLPFYLGGTIGKLITGLRIVSESDKTLSFKRIAFRQTAGYIFSWTFFGLGYWSIFKDPNRQAWHDKIVGSKVIVVQKNWIFGIILLVALIFGSGSMIYKSIESFVYNSPLQTQLRNIYFDFANQTKEENRREQLIGISKSFLDSQIKISTHLDNKDYYKAQTEAEKLLNEAKNDRQKILAYQTLGQVFNTKSDFTSALNYLEKALNYNSNYVGINATLGQTYFYKKDYKTAQTYFDKTIELAPNLALYYYYQGITLLNAGQKDKGTYYLEKAVELSNQSEIFKNEFIRSKNSKLPIMPSLEIEKLFTGINITLDEMQFISQDQETAEEYKKNPQFDQTKVANIEQILKKRSEILPSIMKNDTKLIQEYDNLTDQLQKLTKEIYQP